MKMGEATLNQVALRAGVSISAASMILNNKLDVSFSEDTINRVRQAAKELQYIRRADRASGRLPLGNRTIFIFAPNVISPYYSVLLQSIEQAARNKGYDTLIYNTYRNAENEKRMISLAKSCGAAGVIFTMMPKLTQLIEQESHTLPIVVIGDRDSALNVDTVETSNYAAGVLLAEHLIKLGHRHIAFISTPFDIGSTARGKRLDGMRDTFERLCPDAGILVKSRSITPQQELDTLMLEYTEGFELTLQAISDKSITVFVGMNDMIAYGIIDAVSSRGYSIPDDYSVAGFDNSFPSGFFPMSLTTVEPFIEDKGHNAFEILYQKMSKNSGTDNSSNFITRIEYSQRLVVRSSTAAPREYSSV